jgi:hypothetical protein
MAPESAAMVTAVFFPILSVNMFGPRSYMCVLVTSLDTRVPESIFFGAASAQAKLVRRVEVQRNLDPVSLGAVCACGEILIVTYFCFLCRLCNHE